MKQFIHSTIIVLSFLLFCVSCSMAEEIVIDAKEVRLAMDYAMSGLTEKAKEVLVPLLHDQSESPSEEQIRYVLGAICMFEEKNGECAEYH